MNKSLSGAVAGFVATVPMTVVMLVLHNQLPWREKHPLPPEDITKRLAARAGVFKHMDHEEHQIATLIAHFGFGAAAGALYGPLADKVKAPAAVKGVIFGLLVWAVSYLGWLPGAGIINQPKEQQARPNWLMVVAHIVWGITLGVLAERGDRG